MKASILFAGVALVLAAITAVVLVRESSTEVSAADGGGERLLPVQAAEVRLHAFADTVEAIGTVRASESVEITAGVTDTISELRFDSGAEVGQGDVLVRLDDTEERAALAEAQAAVAEARRDNERLTTLADDGVSTQSERDQARSVLEQNRARLAVVRAQLSDRTIRAPFNGVIGLRNVSPGARVGPGDVLLMLDDLSSVKLDFTVPERFLSVLEPGLSIEATATAWPDMAFKGDISGIDSRVDPVSRTVAVRAVLPNDERRLRPGMLLSVEVRRNERQSPAVPEIAVLRNGANTWVFGIDESGEQVLAVRRPLRLGLRAGSLIEVREGLQAGDMIISEGMDRAADGEPVNIEGRMEDESVPAASAS